MNSYGFIKLFGRIYDCAVMLFVYFKLALVFIQAEHFMKHLTRYFSHKGRGVGIVFAENRFLPETAKGF